MPLSNRHLLHNFDSGVVKKISLPVASLIITTSLVAGGVSGFAATSFSNRGDTNNAQSAKAELNNPQSLDKKTAGIKDTKTFPDQAEGILREGGFEGEGSYHLERPGGKSQNAYLTSSTIDLSEFIGQKVKVWGATFRASKAGWLMDVGYLEVL